MRLQVMGSGLSNHYADCLIAEVLTVSCQIVKVLKYLPESDAAAGSDVPIRQLRVLGEGQLQLDVAGQVMGTKVRWRRRSLSNLSLPDFAMYPKLLRLSTLAHLSCILLGLLSISSTCCNNCSRPVSPAALFSTAC